MAVWFSVTKIIGEVARLKAKTRTINLSKEYRITRNNLHEGKEDAV
jgi:hypothetical protein